MRVGKGTELPSDLRQAQRRFQAWRSQRTSRTRIPLPLWDLAVRLVQRHGLNRTATVLRLDYYSLKKHADLAAPAQASGPAFVELPTPLGLGKQCHLDMANGTGATLRVQLLGYDVAAVDSLVRTFWNAQ